MSNPRCKACRYGEVEVKGPALRALGLCESCRTSNRRCLQDIAIRARWNEDYLPKRGTSAARVQNLDVDSWPRPRDRPVFRRLQAGLAARDAHDALIAGPRPYPGEDWTGAVCRKSIKDWGPCLFCGERIRYGQTRAVLDGEEAHYDCAPGLGAGVIHLSRQTEEE